VHLTPFLSESSNRFFKFYLILADAAKAAFIAEPGEQVECRVHLTGPIARAVKFSLTTKKGKRVGSGEVTWTPPPPPARPSPPLSGPVAVRALAGRCFRPRAHRADEAHLQFRSIVAAF
jgi:hypothetical protein